MVPATHHLLPAAMRELAPPWNDLTWDRERKLEELPHTEANERAALDALTAALHEPPYETSAVWSGASPELFDRIRPESMHWLGQSMPTADRLTLEAVADLIRGWAETAEPPVSPRVLEEQLAPAAAALAAYALSDWAHDLLRWLRQEPRNEERIAAVAEGAVEKGLSSHEAVSLLRDIGAPHGENALLRVVRKEDLSESDHAWARESLRHLRSPRYEARAQEPVSGEEPLLPPPTPELPYSWDYGFQWPQDLPETDENFAFARAILEAGAPTAPVPEPVPHPEWQGYEDDEPPVWLEARAVLRALMPYARLVTRQRLTEAMQECALLGIPGVPQDPGSEEAEGFIRQWGTWIGGWIAGEVFAWLGMYVDDQTSITPWALELAEQYTRHGVAAEQAVGMLRWWNAVPRSREALARIVADDSLPPEVREPAQAGLEQE
ncbi:hypothetical protein [Streptomyces colonosanans]|uniref:Uncharacterized protein n=1 Tax=Streptomyces colonosanans TaxID=1428652 RepID=A0A1S2NT74_9ACTN|nr:hypothetical protein [Streptomyces colonosanans]OIJ84657.1 hypothetical protein BIV24_30505 [Streptomyces colonosanans]